MDAMFQKIGAVLSPADDEAIELLRKLKIGYPVKVKLTRPRNYQFHKKWFALLDLAYDWFEPAENMAMKNKERFRKDITILCGFYNESVRLNGDVRIEAKSISFSSMSQEDFDSLFDKTIDVVLKYVCKNITEKELRNQVADMVVSFA